MDDDTWTIAELADRAGAALAADGSAQVSGRVRDLPNERLIRWYTTIGLIDPPLGRRGRTALYGPRHLLQLVAVKRRQASGRSISEIQIELAAATDADLARIAALPGPPGTRSGGLPAPGAPHGRTTGAPGSSPQATRDAEQAPHGHSPASPESQGGPPTAPKGAEGSERELLEHATRCVVPPERRCQRLWRRPSRDRPGRPARSRPHRAP
ncbi:MerR family transcriptional regulator [Actinomadura luteofluorescens]|uniref:MerR family transcriptional regulator n=1 Tax=Actinomadura luteofluorescens TaxID=46163 RepID=UPI00362F42C1